MKASPPKERSSCSFHVLCDKLMHRGQWKGEERGTKRGRKWANSKAEEGKQRNHWSKKAKALCAHNNQGCSHSEYQAWLRIYCHDHKPPPNSTNPRVCSRRFASSKTKCGFMGKQMMSLKRRNMLQTQIQHFYLSKCNVRKKTSNPTHT